MDDLLARELSKRKEFLERIIKEKSAVIAQGGPGGRLRCVDRQGRPEYYWRNNPKNTTGIYLPPSKHDFAALVAQSTYDQMVLSYAQEELRCLNKLAKQHQLHNVEGIYCSYGLHRKALVDPIWIPDDEFVTNWLQQKYSKNIISEDAPAYYTKRNEKMRSKSEIIISDILTDLNIPYLYEKPLLLQGFGWIFPDFTALNVRLREIRYWEHFGKMGDSEYVDRNLDKILAYEKNGYYPGTQLIITHETDMKPVDTRLLRNVAIHYLT